MASEMLDLSKNPIPQHISESAGRVISHLYGEGKPVHYDGFSHLTEHTPETLGELTSRGLIKRLNDGLKIYELTDYGRELAEAEYDKAENLKKESES